MNEASKTRAIRQNSFYATYMHGSVLDIGSGGDLVVPHAVSFDQPQGDANYILNYLKPETFDCVHSSHTLEHIFSPKKCLQDWWALVKPGGFLVTVVPDEDLYEQGIWPSIFNPDHKSTFRLTGASSWSPASYNLPELIAALPGAKIVSAQRQDNGYIYRKPLWSFPCPGFAKKLIRKFLSIIRRIGLAGTLGERFWIILAFSVGCQVDQTSGRALAQIEVIAIKTSSR